jgi:hypothetical protein
MQNVNNEGANPVQDQGRDAAAVSLKSSYMTAVPPRACWAKVLQF